MSLLKNCIAIALALLSFSDQPPGVRPEPELPAKQVQGDSLEASYLRRLQSNCDNDSKFCCTSTGANWNNACYWCTHSVCTTLNTCTPPGCTKSNTCTTPGCTPSNTCPASPNDILNDGKGCTGSYQPFDCSKYVGVSTVDKSFKFYKDLPSSLDPLATTYLLQGWTQGFKTEYGSWCLKSDPTQNCDFVLANGINRDDCVQQTGGNKGSHIQITNAGKGTTQFDNCLGYSAGLSKYTLTCKFSNTAQFGGQQDISLSIYVYSKDKCGSWLGSQSAPDFTLIIISDLKFEQLSASNLQTNLQSISYNFADFYTDNSPDDPNGGKQCKLLSCTFADTNPGHIINKVFTQNSNAELTTLTFDVKTDLSQAEQEFYVKCITNDVTGLSEVTISSIKITITPIPCDDQISYVTLPIPYQIVTVPITPILPYEDRLEEVQYITNKQPILCPPTILTLLNEDNSAYIGDGLKIDKSNTADKHKIKAKYDIDIALTPSNPIKVRVKIIVDIKIYLTSAFETEYQCELKELLSACYSLSVSVDPNQQDVNIITRKISNCIQRSTFDICNTGGIWTYTTTDPTIAWFTLPPGKDPGMDSQDQTLEYSARILGSTSMTVKYKIGKTQLFETPTPFIIEIKCPDNGDNTVTLGKNKEQISYLPLCQYSATLTSLFNACPVIEVEAFIQDASLTTKTDFFKTNKFPGMPTYTFEPTVSNCIVGEYEFALKVKNKDTQIVMIENLKLKIQCYNATVTIQWQPTFVTSKILVVGQTSKDIYQFLPTISNPVLCPVAYYQIIDIKRDGVLDPSQSLISWASSCLGMPCFSLDLYRTDQAYELKFRIKSILVQTATSPWVTLKVVCQASSSTLSNPISSKIFDFTQYQTSSTGVFSPPDCVPADCCYLSYKTTALSQALSAPKITLSIPFLNSKGKVEISEISTGTLGFFTFYIYAFTPKNHFIYSGEMKVNIIYDCNFAQFRLKKTNPAELEEPFKFIVPIDGSNPFLSVNVTLGKYDQLSIDLAERFEYNASGQCPFFYEISRVEDQDLQKDLEPLNYNKIMDLTKEGFMLLPRVTKSIKYKVYLNVTNGFISFSPKSPQLVLQFNDANSFSVSRPTFKTSLIVQKFDATEIPENQKFLVIQLPEIESSDKEAKLTIELQNKKLGYARVDSEKRQLIVDKTLIKDMSMVSIGLRLQQKGGSHTDYTQIIQVFKRSQIFQVKQEVQEVEQVEEVVFQEKNFTAKIQQIGLLGELELTFNASLNEKLNFSQFLNNSIVDLYVEPFIPKGESIQDRNVSRLNFTWKVIKVEKRSILLNLNFTNFAFISPHRVQDSLVFHLRNKSELFYSPEVQNYLHKDSWTLKAKLRKQIANTNFNKKVIASSETASKGTQVMIGISLVLMTMCPGQDFKYFQWYMRSLQMVTHLPMLGTLVPGIVSKFMEQLVPIITFDFLAPEWTTELVFDFDYKEQEKGLEEILDQTENIGYESHNSILVLGSIWIFMCLIFVKLFLFLVLSAYKKLKPEANVPFIKKWKNSILNDFISLFLEGYFEFLISCFMNIRLPLKTVNGEIVGLASSYMVLGLCILLPLTVIYHLRGDNYVKFYEEEFQAKWGSLFDRIRKFKWFYAMYNLVFMVRRIIFVAVVFYLDNLVSMQLLTVIFMNLFSMLYSAHSPFEGVWLNRYGMMNEFMIVTLTLHMFLFTDAVDDPVAQDEFGWSMSLIFSSYFSLQLSILLFIWLRSVYMVYRRYRRWLRRKLHKIYVRSKLQKLLDEIKEFKKTRPARRRRGRIGGKSPKSSRQKKEKAKPELKELQKIKPLELPSLSLQQETPVIIKSSQKQQINTLERGLEIPRIAQKIQNERSVVIIKKNLKDPQPRLNPFSHMIQHKTEYQKYLEEKLKREKDLKEMMQKHQQREAEALPYPKRLAPMTQDQKAHQILSIANPRMADFMKKNEFKPSLSTPRFGADDPMDRLEKKMAEDKQYWAKLKPYTYK